MLASARSGAASPEHVFVLVTGATGTIGAALVPRLIGEGHELWAWVRDEQRARQALGDDVHLLSERAGPDALERAVGEVEAIVNLAGEGVADGRWTKGRKEAIRSSRIDLTRRLVEGIGRAKRPPGARCPCPSYIGKLGELPLHR